jgi:hypothetical protein
MREPRTEQTWAANDPYLVRTVRSAAGCRAKSGAGDWRSQFIDVSAAGVYVSAGWSFPDVGALPDPFNQDLATLCGAILGGVGGFLLARSFSPKLANRSEWQPVIISVGLPPDLVRIDNSPAE